MMMMICALSVTTWPWARNSSGTRTITVPSTFHDVPFQLVSFTITIGAQHGRGRTRRRQPILPLHRHRRSSRSQPQKNPQKYLRNGHVLAELSSRQGVEEGALCRERGERVNGYRVDDMDSFDDACVSVDEREGTESDGQRSVVGKLLRRVRGWAYLGLRRPKNSKAGVGGREFRTLINLGIRTRNTSHRLIRLSVSNRNQDISLSAFHF